MNVAGLNRPQLLAPHEQPAVEELIATAATALSIAFATPVRLHAIEAFAYQPHVIRCRVQGAADLPATVIIKQAKNRGEQRYNPDDAAFWSLAYRLFNDWAGSQFLRMVSPYAHFGPALLAGNRVVGFIVLEDLGDDTSLKHALLGQDAQQAEAELIQIAAVLGRMHAATAGHQPTFERLRDGLGLRDPTMYPFYAGYLRSSQASLQTLLDKVGIAPPAQLSAEVTALVMALADPDDFAAYTHGDPCPLNWLKVNSKLRLVDFEFGSFGHALLDAMHARMLFPTFTFAQHIPQPVIEHMERVYRSELVKGCSAAADDLIFGRAAVSACAFWTLFSVIRDLKPALMMHDEQAKLACQCLMARLRAFIGVAEGAGRFPALRQLAELLIGKLVDAWPIDADALPYYPAFRQTIHVGQHAE